MKHEPCLCTALLLVTTIFSHGQDDWDTLLVDGFDQGSYASWNLDSGWTVRQDNGNFYLTGTGHSWARCKHGQSWTDYSLQLNFRIRSGTMHVNFRLGQTPVWRYFLGIDSDGVYLKKQVEDEFLDIDNQPVTLASDSWHALEIVASERTIQVYVNEVLQIQYYDEEALEYGGIAFETLESADMDVDSILVIGEDVLQPVEGITWYRTGGPIGGLGYDIRIHPREKHIMFVTDNPSGVNKSTDGGTSWMQKNKGINVHAGTSNEAVPIFSLTIDPNNPDIVWSGMQYARGIFKSIDGGESWQLRVNGIAEGNEISFRGFAIHPGNSDVVLAAAEITTGEPGIEFDKTRGKIYKTVDGGDNWYPVWEGNNLARVLIYNYLRPDTVFCSTGIFDREAYNSDIANGILGGVGILRSYDGGESWHMANTGIDNLYLGFLEMHPVDPDILFAAASNNATSYPPNHSFGGIYKTTDGGDHWMKVVSQSENYGAVTISPSNPDIVYAIGGSVYRSEDCGDTWQRPTGTSGWGPPGINPGFVISAVVDPEDPDIVWVNNYGGGNFVSRDGGESWANSSKGYTGANVHDISITSDNPNMAYLTSRAGPYVTYNGGEDWIGLNYQGGLSESYTIAVFKDNPFEILAANDGTGNIVKSWDGGFSWVTVFQHPLVNADNPGNRHTFRDIAVSSSNPEIVYAGMGKVINVGMVDPSAEEGFGMYKSNNRGETWTQANNGLESSGKTINAIAIHPADPDIVYIGTLADGIYKTINGGETWEAVNAGLPSSDIRSIAVDPIHPDTVYAGTGNGMGMAISYNGGGSWSIINEGLKLVCPTYLSPYGKALKGMDLSQPPIPSSANYGIPWTKILDIVVNPADPAKVYAADLSSGVLYSEDHGQSWGLITGGMGIKAIKCLSISPNGDVLYCGSEGEGVYRLVLGNQVPNIYARIPTSDTITIYQGDTTQLEVFCSDLNQDTLKYTWRIDGESMVNDASSLTFQSGIYDLGYHEVTVTASDGDTATVSSWTLQIIALPSNIPKTVVGGSLNVYPNPFSNTLSIGYYLESHAHVRISVMDIQSRVVSILSDRMQAAGKHSLMWYHEQGYDAGNPGGIYVIRVMIQYDDVMVTQEKKVIKIN